MRDGQTYILVPVLTFSIGMLLVVLGTRRLFVHAERDGRLRHVILGVAFIFCGELGLVHGLASLRVPDPPAKENLTGHSYAHVPPERYAREVGGYG